MGDIGVILPRLRLARAEPAVTGRDYLGIMPLSHRAAGCGGAYVAAWSITLSHIHAARRRNPSQVISGRHLLFPPRRRPEPRQPAPTLPRGICLPQCLGAVLRCPRLTPGLFSGLLGRGELRLQGRDPVRSASAPARSASLPPPPVRPGLPKPQPASLPARPRSTTPPPARSCARAADLPDRAHDRSEDRIGFLSLAHRPR